MSHTVRLPHPDRQEPTVGRCDCGWTVTYRWGGHGDAEAEAAEHIRQAAQAEPVVAVDMSGLRTLYEGTSL